MAELGIALAGLLAAVLTAIWDRLVDSKIVVTRAGRHRERAKRYIDRVRVRPVEQDVPDGGRPDDGP